PAPQGGLTAARLFGRAVVTPAPVTGWAGAVAPRIAGESGPHPHGRAETGKQVTPGCGQDRLGGSRLAGGAVVVGRFAPVAAGGVDRRGGGVQLSEAVGAALGSQARAQEVGPQRMISVPALPHSRDYRSLGR